jgi:competence ComEA-like helix-hairpin-helix protein
MLLSLFVVNAIINNIAGAGGRAGSQEALPPPLGTAGQARSMNPTPAPLEASLWPRSAQVIAALLVTTTLCLLAWHGHLGSRSSTHPSQLRRPAHSAQADDNYDRTQSNSEDEATASVALVARDATDLADMPARPSGRSPAVGIKKLVAGDERLDVNRATLTELQRLPGVGPSLAARIVERREVKPFDSVDDLRKVKGIGPKILEAMRPVVTVGAPRSASSEGH